MKAIQARARECEGCFRIDLLSTESRGWAGPPCPCGSERYEELGVVELPLAGGFAEIAGHLAPTRAQDARDQEKTHDLSAQIDQED